MNRIRRSPGVVVGVVALVVAMAGGAAALPGKNSVKSNDIAKNAVKSKHIKSVKAADLADGSVGADAIAAGAVGAAALAQSSVGAAALAQSSVGAAALAPGSVGTSELANGSVTDAKLAASVAGETVSSDGVVTVPTGQTATLFSSGPFSVKARCVDSGGDIGATILFSSTEAQTVSTIGGVAGPDEADAHFDGVDTFGAGDGNPNAIIPPVGVGIWRSVTFALNAPSGAALTGNLGVGVILHGSSCEFAGHGVS